MQEKQLLIVCNTPSENTLTLAQSAQDGANHPDVVNVHVNFKTPDLANATDVMHADGILLGTTENFGYMSGLMKDFFERIYYPCLEQTQGIPYALFVRAGNDGSGAQNAVERIVTGLRWKAVQPPLILQGEFKDSFIDQTRKLGLLMAAGLDNSAF